MSWENYSGLNFGTHDVLTPISGTSGNDRFYVMALNDFSTLDYSKFYWYYEAYGNMSDYKTYTSKNFGTGKINTDKMIVRYNLGTTTAETKYGTLTGYGAENAQDVWKNIQTKVSEGWFVPSEVEWDAFAQNLGVTSSNYQSTYRLKS